MDLVIITFGMDLTADIGKVFGILTSFCEFDFALCAQEYIMFIKICGHSCIFNSIID